MGRRKSPEKPLFNPYEANKLILDILKHCVQPEDGLTKSHIWKEISKHYSCTKDDFETCVSGMESSGKLRRVGSHRYASNEPTLTQQQAKPKSLEEHVDRYGSQHDIELR